MEKTWLIFIAILYLLSGIVVAQDIPPNFNLSVKILCADSLIIKNQTDFYIDQLNKRINLDHSSKLNNEFYNLAICYSAKKQIDSTFYYLFKSIDLSPKYNGLIITDTDFEFLHHTQRWCKMVNQIDSIYLSQYPNITKKELAVELYHILLKDQHARGFGLKMKDKSLMNTDSLNLKRVEEIIQQYGWPTFSMVGKESANGAFLVIQHSNITTQSKYFKQIFYAVKNNEASKESLALLYDRMSVHFEGKQKFGTQVYQKRDSITGKLGSYKYFPIKNEAKVDSLRKEMGLIPLKQYLALFGIDYKPVTK